jgi:hypothetical protein
MTYPNTYSVQTQMPDNNWHTLLGSVGNKSYAEGYFAALQAFNPRPAYRIIGKKGETIRESESRAGVHLN